MKFWIILNAIIGIILIVSILLELFGIGEYNLSRPFFMFLFSLIVICFKGIENIEKKLNNILERGE